MKILQARKVSCNTVAPIAVHTVPIIRVCMPLLRPLLHTGLTAPEPARGWSHDWVHTNFVGQLIQRRKLYASNLRRILPDLLALRHKGDYRATRVSQREAQQAVRSAQALVQAVTAHLQGGEGST